MKNTKIFTLAAAALCGIATFSACSSDSDGGSRTNFGQGDYVIAAVSENEEATYLLQTENIESGALSTTGDGLEVDNATFWAYYKNKYLYRLVYAQGNAGVCTAYAMNADGNLYERSMGYNITSRFTTHGVYGDYIVMAASGATTEKENDLNKYGVTFSIIDVNSQSMITKTVVTENMVDNNGEYYTFSGIVESGGKLYSALCPQGYSAYGVSKGRVPAEHTDLVNSETNILSPTIHPDKVWVAVYNSIDDLESTTPTIISDERISFATSRMQSQFYPTIAADAIGNIYVFSASNSYYNTSDTYAAGSPYKSTKPCGVIRIPAGGNAFDSYYANIEELSGGYPLFNVWHVAGDYFLLQMYTDKTYEKTTSATPKQKLAIFRASSQSFAWVTGLPTESQISSFSRTPYFEDGKAYMPVTTLDGAQPAVYVIDAQTATATKGVVVESSSIGAIGKLDNY